MATTATITSKRGAGLDVVYGGNGNDQLYGGAGNDLLAGGDGNDAIFGQDGHEWLFGGRGNDQLFGGAGNDLLAGGDGNDRLEGGAGNDFFFSGNGSNTYVGGAGTDSISFAGHPSSVNVNLANGTARIGAGPLQTLLSIENVGDTPFDDIVIGSAANNFIEGNAGNDLFSGGLGNDGLSGGSGNDTLFGGAGNDVLYGQDGNDLLQGDGGADLLFGGLGADRFRFDDGHTGLGALRNRIVDFSRAQGDKLDLSLIDANLGRAGDQAFTFIGTGNFTGLGQLRVVSSGTDRILQGNNTGDLRADFEIVLIDFGTAVQAGDFSGL